LGDIIRLCEESETVIDCLDGENHLCRLLPACRLKGVLDEAAGAFFAIMDSYTLADLMKQRPKMKAVLGLSVAGPKLKQTVLERNRLQT